METAYLHEFAKVAECGSFTAAARELHLTQSTLSKHVALLEREFGADLFVRDRSGVSLTEAGGKRVNSYSGGMRRRLDLAVSLIARPPLIFLDEPTTGLHFEDVRQLLIVLQRLVDAGNTVLVIEHNLDVIKCADRIVDLGPEGGERGGTVVAQGTPEEVAQVEGSYTGAFVKKMLEDGRL